MKSAVKEYTETILSIITDAMDNDLSLQWLKDKIEGEISLMYAEKEEQQIIDAYRQGVEDWSIDDFSTKTKNTISERYFNETFKHD